MSAKDVIYGPDIGFEYSWMNNLGCLTGRAAIVKQESLRQVGRRHDRMTFKCSDVLERQLYFDFSSDPAIQEFDRKLLERMKEPLSQPE